MKLKNVNLVRKEFFHTCFHHSVSLLISDPNPLKGPSYTKNQGRMQHCSNKQT